MDPVSIGTASMAMGAAGGVTSAAGSILGGKASSKNYKYQAGVAKLNAQIAKQNEEYAIREGETEAFQSGRKTQFLIGTQKAQQGARNLDVNTGSPAAVRESQAEVGKIDQSIIRYRAGRRAYGFEVEAAKQEAQSKVYQGAAKTSMTAGYIGAATSILGMGSSVADKWLKGMQSGMYSSGGNPIAGDAYSFDDSMPTNYGDY